MYKQQEKQPPNLNKLQNELNKGNHLFSYKQLCKLLDGDYKKNSGNSKICQIKFWANFCNINHIGYKYEITEIYDTPLKTMEELNGRLKSHPEFLVPYECRNMPGIYQIYNDDYIYFGSTVSFRNRFRQHLKENLYSQISLKNIDILHNNGFFDMVEQCILTDRDKSKDITFVNDSPLSISIDKRLQNIDNSSSFTEDNIRVCSCKTMRELELYYIHKYYLEQLEHDFQSPYNRKLLNSIGITRCKNNNLKKNKSKLSNQQYNKKIITSIPFGFLNDNPIIKQSYLDFINTIKTNMNSLNMTDEQIDDFFKLYTKNFDFLLQNNAINTPERTDENGSFPKEI